MANAFLNRKSTCDLTDVPASIYDRKEAPKHMRLSGTDGLKWRFHPNYGCSRNGILFL